jgi:hypothetical protein
VELSRFDAPKLALMIAAPLAWAVLLWFHPSVKPDDVYGSLRDQVVTYQIVHAGTLVFIGLVGVALYALVRDLPGTAARISRVAIGPFLVMYAAWEAVIGLATGALVQHANEAPAAARPELSDAIQSLQENLIVGEMSAVAVAGGLAWITATIAAAVAYRRVGAPVLVSILLGLSLVVVSHPPPIGPIGLACFAAAVALVARGARASETVAAARPAPALAPPGGAPTHV